MKPPKWRFSRYVTIGKTRVVAWAALGAFLGVATSMLANGFEITTGWHYVTQSPASQTFQALQVYFHQNLAPMILLSLFAALSFGTIGALGGGLAGFLPPRYAVLVDGVALAGVFLALFEISGLSPFLRSLPGSNMLNLVAVWALFLATSGLLWNHLPFGLRYRTHARREVALPASRLRDALIPTRTAMATNIEARPFLDGLTPNSVVREGHDRYRLAEEPGKSPWRVLRLHFSETAPGKTLVSAEVSINALSPMAWWDFATRPYLDDYFDHVVARMTGTHDRSIYGMLAEKREAKAGLCTTETAATDPSACPPGNRIARKPGIAIAAPELPN